MSSLNYAHSLSADGKMIPAGANIIISAYMMGRSADIFPDPDVFKPERFDVVTSADITNPYSYVPFSAGPRNCIGKPTYCQFGHWLSHLVIEIFNYHCRTKICHIRIEEYDHQSIEELRIGTAWERLWACGGCWADFTTGRGYSIEIKATYKSMRVLPPDMQLNYVGNFLYVAMLLNKISKHSTRHWFTICFSFPRTGIGRCLAKRGALSRNQLPRTTITPKPNPKVFLNIKFVFF